MTGSAGGTETVCPSGAPEASRFGVAQSFYLCVVFFSFLLFFVFLSLLLSVVLLRFTASNYPFGIFKQKINLRSFTRKPLLIVGQNFYDVK
jgi:hypothetical protein